MNLDKRTLEKMSMLANGFANQRVAEELDRIEEIMKASDGLIKYSRRSVEKEVGRLLATAYAKGYADAAENIDVKRLIF